jgi:phosphatidylglycerol:prolipoprotein diacylglycerol transferase
MIPVLFHLGPIPINSFGLMMVLALLVGWRRLAIDLTSRGEEFELAERMVFWGAVGGFAGARIGFIASFPEFFIQDPFGTIFGGAGFVYYGGLIGGTAAVYFLVRNRKFSFLQYCDASAITLCVGYAVGRIGCHLSGDGDYGGATDLPWAVSYRLGIVPTPENVLVHPSPIYETLMALLSAYILLAVSSKTWAKTTGRLFGLYLILASIARFLVEYVRIEPVVLLELTQAQVMSVLMFLIGTFLLARKRSEQKG